jgi:hypothetical protein
MNGSFRMSESRQSDEIIRHWSGPARAIPAEEKDVADVTSILPSRRFSTFSTFETAPITRARS